MAELYADFKEEKLTQKEYILFKSNYIEKIEAIDKSIKKLSRLESDYKQKNNCDDLKIYYKQYQNIESLSRSMVVELIDEILVHEGGTVEIKFKFEGPFVLS